MAKTYRHACGCRSTDSAWIELCPACKAEHDNTHLRWKAEHIERQQKPNNAAPASAG